MRRFSQGLSVLFAALTVYLAGCAGNATQVFATFNHSAALVGDLPMNPSAWPAISSAVDLHNGTMSTTYGNDAAVDFARTHSQHDYPAAAVISVVTWTQAEDARWFGAKVPGQVKSVEFVTVEVAENGEPKISYDPYTGNPLKGAAAPESSTARQRIEGILSRRASVMP